MLAVVMRMIQYEGVHYLFCSSKEVEDTFKSNPL